MASSALDIPRIFTITESAHRIHNPITPEKLATLGAALRLAPRARLDAEPERYATYTRDHLGWGVLALMPR